VTVDIYDFKRHISKDGRLSAAANMPGDSVYPKDGMWSCACACVCGKLAFKKLKINLCMRFLRVYMCRPTCGPHKDCHASYIHFGRNVR